MINELQNKIQNAIHRKLSNLNKAKLARIEKNAQVIDGTEVIFIPLHNKSYAFEMDGQRWVFINSRLRDKKRSELLTWGLSFTGEMGVQR